MYQINLYFQSDVKGVYTKEEEIATNEEQLERKLTKMLQRWTKILLPKMLDVIINGLSRQELSIIIDDKIANLNKKEPGEQIRVFRCTVTVQPMEKLEDSINEREIKYFSCLDGVKAPDHSIVHVSIFDTEVKACVATSLYYLTFDKKYTNEKRKQKIINMVKKDFSSFVNEGLTIIEEYDIDKVPTVPLDSEKGKYSLRCSNCEKRKIISQTVI